MALAPGRYAVIDCEDAEVRCYCMCACLEVVADASSALQKWRGHEQLWIKVLRESDDEQWDVFRAYAQDLPSVDDACSQYRAFVLTGSHYSVTDDLPWIAALKEFVVAVTRAAEQRGSPHPRVFGGCFGHQLLASALGGRAGRNPGGSFVLGAESITLAPGEAQALGVQRVQRLLESHEDQVLEAPPGSSRMRIGGAWGGRGGGRAGVQQVPVMAATPPADFARRASRRRDRHRNVRNGRR